MARARIAARVAATRAIAGLAVAAVALAAGALPTPLASVLPTPLASVLSTALGPASAHAAPNAPKKPRKTVRAIRATRSPTVDGVLNDPAWREATFISDFSQKQPIEGAPPTRHTEVAFVYDGDALYVGARMTSRGRSDIRAVMTRRDDTGDAERLIISLDTFLDHRTAYSFAITAAGVRADWYHPEDQEHNRDPSYDPVWQGRAVLGDDGWTAEMRIPFSQLRFPAASQHRWGININRYIPHENEDIFWIPVPKDQQAWSSYFGELVGITGIRPRTRIELLPYVATNATLTSADLIADGDPFAQRLDANARIGLDAEFGLGPNLTLNLTAHPDFGQVEADPAVVDLSGFEVFFDEQRPFFTEGNQKLTGTGPIYFNSRRIGAAPRGRASGEFVDQPTATDILGAAKLTGRLRSGLSIGALTALTPRTHARVADAADPDSISRIAVEPLTSYNALRVEQELDPPGSTFGASFTATYRDMADGEPLAATLARDAYTGGLDWRLRLGGGVWEILGFAGLSAVRGEAAAITAIQTNPVHHFQRPDQNHAHLDVDAESLVGATGGLSFEKRSGAWVGGAQATMETPGFEINDLGRLSRADDINVDAIASYQQTRPGVRLHAWSVGVDAHEEWNFGGDREPGSVAAFADATTRGFWQGVIRGVLRPPGVSDSATRGGPLAGVGWGGDVSVSLSNGRTSRYQFGLGATLSAHRTHRRGLAVGAAVSLHPADRFSLSLTPEYVRTSDSRQYLDTIDDPAAGGGADTFGARYVLATVARRELSVEIRAQLAISPALSVQLFAQPFVSSGRFTAFGELPAPGSRSLRVYADTGATITRQDGELTIADDDGTFTLDDPDFTVLSLRSTAVLRWEFRPGSTLFAVWQQERGDSLPAALDATPGSLGDSVTAPSVHTVALKLAYWWSP